MLCVWIEYLLKNIFVWLRIFSFVEVYWTPFKAFMGKSFVRFIFYSLLKVCTQQTFDVKGF